MARRLRTWWLKIKQRPLIATAIIVAFFAFIVFIFAVYKFGWDWTGFNGGYGQVTTHTPAKDTVLPAAKTLWDWLQLLIVPIILVVGGFWLNQIQSSREQSVAEKRAQTEREITSDNQREAALQDYIDKMSELLLHEDLRKSSEDAEVRRLAVLQTLTALPRLDGRRKGTVLLFLYEAGLIDKSNPIVMFGAAGLHAADLRGCDLSGFRGASLSSSFISYAMLDGADFTDMHLREILFEGGSLCKARFIGADLCGSEFYRINLSGVDLTRADLTDASLVAVDLTGAIVTDEQLDKARLLQGAIMPDGSKHP